MGLIKAGMGALGGTLADQWKEFFYCDSLDKDVLMVKGQKRTSRRSSNNGEDNIITNGSGIAVADGQCILLLCNISDIVPNTEVELYPSTGEELVFSPFLSGENGHVVQADGVCDFTIYPEGDDWETDTSPWSLEGNWLEIYRDTDEGVFDTDPADADRMCFLPTDADTEGSQLPFTASYITPYPELNVEEADLFYQEGTPEVPFQTNQEWYATFTGEDGSRYAVTLEDEDTLALKFYLDGEESYMSLVNTVYFARQEAMG